MLDTDELPSSYSIVPTIDAGEEFKEAAFSWLQSNPAQILIVTETKMREPLQELANAVDPTRITVLTVPKANKRLQMAHGIRNTTTDIIAFADDDAIWPPTMLQWVLACFEDQQVGGVGTSQRVKPQSGKMTVWEVLAAFRLSIRNFEIASSTHIDGGVPCLSGRTAAYRTVILKDPAFLQGFTNDYWLGKYLLNSGDDKFLTRLVASYFSIFTNAAADSTPFFVLDQMDGQSRLEHVHPSLPGSRAAVDHEARLAIPEAGSSMDP